MSERNQPSQVGDDRLEIDFFEYDYNEAKLDKEKKPKKLKGKR